MKITKYYVYYILFNLIYIMLYDLLLWQILFYITNILFKSYITNILYYVFTLTRNMICYVTLSLNQSKIITLTSPPTPWQKVFHCLWELLNSPLLGC